MDGKLGEDGTILVKHLDEEFEDMDGKCEVVEK